MYLSYQQSIPFEQYWNNIHTSSHTGLIYILTIYKMFREFTSSSLRHFLQNKIKKINKIRLVSHVAAPLSNNFIISVHVAIFNKHCWAIRQHGRGNFCTDNYDMSLKWHTWINHLKLESGCFLKLLRIGYMLSNAS